MWGFTLKDRTPLLETRGYGLEQGTEEPTLPPPELPTRLYSSDLPRDSWFVFDSVGKELPCEHTAVTSSLPKASSRDLFPFNT